MQIGAKDLILFVWQAHLKKVLGKTYQCIILSHLKLWQELRAWFAGTEACHHDEWLIKEREALDIVANLVNTFRWPSTSSPSSNDHECEHQQCSYYEDADRYFTKGLSLMTLTGRESWCSSSPASQATATASSSMMLRLGNKYNQQTNNNEYNNSINNKFDKLK